MTDRAKWDFGGGANPTVGWTIVDISYTADLKWDLREPFEPEYHGIATEAKFFHGPEHYSRFELPTVLANIHTVLAPDASLEIRCPDMDIWARKWLDEGANADTLGCIFGGQENEWQVHFTGLNFGYLERLLADAGFRNVVRLSQPYQAPLYPNDWRDPSGFADPNKQFDLHVGCRK